MRLTSRLAPLPGARVVSKPVARSAESTRPPSPSIRVPFSTWTRTCAGGTSTGTAAGRPAAAFPGRAGASGRSSRSASKSLAAFGSSHFTVDPMPLTRNEGLPMGTEANSEEEGVKSRIACPRASICSEPNPLSARTEPSRVELSSLNLTGFSSTPPPVACLIRAATNRCWRCIRPRSEAPSTWRERTYCRAWPPVSRWVPGSRSRPVFGSRMVLAVQISTPPIASTVFMKLVKSTSR